jgi:hypothetical protein
MEKKLFTLSEAQELWTKLVKNRSNELKNELREIKEKNSNNKLISYV